LNSWQETKKRECRAACLREYESQLHKRKKVRGEGSKITNSQRRAAAKEKGSELHRKKNVLNGKTPGKVYRVEQNRTGGSRQLKKWNGP